MTRARSMHLADERMAELAALLAAGLTRLLARKSSGKSADARDCSLDFAANQSGHPDALLGRETRHGR